METKKLDGRKLNYKKIDTIRICAFQAVKACQSTEKAIADLGMTIVIIYRWIELFHVGGWKALKTKILLGSPPKLGPSKKRWIFRGLALAHGCYIARMQAGATVVSKLIRIVN